MARFGVRLDVERRRRLEELVEEGGIANRDVARHVIADAYRDIVGVRRRQVTEWLIELNVEYSPYSIPFAMSWMSPMRHVAFIDVKVPIYAAG